MSDADTAAQALIRYGRLHVDQTATPQTVHVRATCDAIADRETRRIVAPTQIPLRAAVCERCGGGN
jgi:hypothetical protein